MTKITATWQHEDLLLEAENDSGNKVTLDSAERVGGKNRGPRPLQLLLMGLAGCTSMDVVSILKKKRQPFTDFQVNVTAERANEHPKVYTSIHIEYVVTGDVSEKAVQDSIRLSEEVYCPASAMLRQAATITSSYRIVRPGD